MSILPSLRRPYVSESFEILTTQIQFNLIELRQKLQQGDGTAKESGISMFHKLRQHNLQKKSKTIEIRFTVFKSVKF
jgi:hypothetical protein